jgi:hypothetical protein
MLVKPKNLKSKQIGTHLKIPQPIGERLVRLVCPSCGVNHATEKAVYFEGQSGDETEKSEYCALCRSGKPLSGGVDGEVVEARRAGVGKYFIKDGELPSLAKFPYDTEIRYTTSYFICGDTGVGKSYLLNCLAVEAIRAAKKVKLLNWSYFKRRVRSCYQAGARKTEEDVYAEYRSVAYLGVDDLGVGMEEDDRETKAARNMIYDLIDARYWDEMTTWITSNLPPADLEKAYDAPIARRIMELCEIVVLTEKL